MRSHIILISLFVMFGTAPLTAAAVENQATYLSIDCDPDDSSHVLDLFDPDFDPARKGELIKKAEDRAEGNCPDDQYTLGTLLRFGRELPGNPLEKDTARAKPLIEAYARSESVLGFADLAELSLAVGDAKDAMLWTQVYLYFVTRHPMEKLKDFDRRGYNADLLVRAIQAWGKAGLRKADIQPLLNAYLSKNKAEILVNMQKVRAEMLPSASTSTGKPSQPPSLQVKPRAKDYLYTYEDLESGYAIFLLEVQPSGVVSRIVAQSFAPSPRVAQKLRKIAEGVSFEPFNWHEPQVARLPVSYGYMDGPSLAKPRR